MVLLLLYATATVSVSMASLENNQDFGVPSLVHLASLAN
jgi:hypothetical protein